MTVTVTGIMAGGLAGGLEGCPIGAGGDATGVTVMPEPSPASLRTTASNTDASLVATARSMTAAGRDFGVC